MDSPLGHGGPLTGADLPVVLIVDRETDRVVERCGGPEPDGSCPWARRGEPVWCAGCDLWVLGPTGIEGSRIEVAPDAVACPLVRGTAAGHG